MKPLKLCADHSPRPVRRALPGRGQPKSDIREVSVKKYIAPGNIWKGESVMETNWNKICEDPQGRIWFSGGDHWGTDRTDIRTATSGPGDSATRSSPSTTPSPTR